MGADCCLEDGEGAGREFVFFELGDFVFCEFVAGFVEEVSGGGLEG